MSIDPARGSIRRQLQFAGPAVGTVLSLLRPVRSEVISLWGADQVFPNIINRASDLLCGSVKEPV